MSYTSSRRLTTSRVQEAEQNNELGSAHEWRPVKILCTVCKHCRVRTNPTAHLYQCSVCEFIIHKECMLNGKNIAPCLSVTQKDLEVITAISGTLEKSSVIKGSILPGSITKWDKRFFVLTHSGILYYFQQGKPLPSGVIRLSDFNSVEEKAGKIIISNETEEFIIKADAASRGPWITKLKELMQQIKNHTIVDASELIHEVIGDQKQTIYYLDGKVSDGKDIIGKDVGGTSDCYCIINSEVGYWRTTTIWKTNAPFWAEKGAFYFPIQDPSTALLKILVFDQNTVASDEIIGEVIIPVNKLLGGAKVDGWKRIKKMLGHPVTGSILLSITKLPSKELKIKLVSCSNLISADANGKSDPFVRFAVGSKKYKSKTVKKTLNPVFNEEFKLPYESNSILEVSVFDWDLVGEDFLGQVAIDVGENFPIGQEVERSYVLEDKISYEEKKQSRKAAKIAGKSPRVTALGSIKIYARLITQTILPYQSYAGLLGLLTENEIPLLRQVSEFVSNKAGFAEDLVRIFDHHRQTLYLMQLLTDFEISGTKTAAVIFRGNTVTTKAIDCFMRFLGKNYIGLSIGPILTEICNSDQKIEIDPTKTDKPGDIPKNAKKIIALSQQILNKIYASVADCPLLMRQAFSAIRSQVETYFQAEDIKVVRYTGISAFLFLRFFVPVILNPSLFGFVEKMTETSSRTCTLVAKIVQNTANLAKFGEKEAYMFCANDFVQSQFEPMKGFIDNICNLTHEQIANSTRNNVRVVHDTWLERELSSAAQHLTDCRSSWAPLLNESRQVQQLDFELQKINEQI